MLCPLSTVACQCGLLYFCWLCLWNQFYLYFSFINGTNLETIKKPFASNGLCRSFGIKCRRGRGLSSGEGISLGWRANSSIHLQSTLHWKLPWHILIEKTGVRQLIGVTANQNWESVLKDSGNKSYNLLQATYDKHHMSWLEKKQDLDELSTWSAYRVTNSCILVNWSAEMALEGLFALLGSQATGTWTLEIKGL